jgi:hypothetical protein
MEIYDYFFVFFLYWSIYEIYNIFLINFIIGNGEIKYIFMEIGERNNYVTGYEKYEIYGR